jgi:hypothetical protein
MSDMDMYKILGAVNNLDKSEETTEAPATEAKKPIYESVKAKGAITEGALSDAVMAMTTKYEGYAVAESVEEIEEAQSPAQKAAFQKMLDAKKPKTEETDVEKDDKAEKAADDVAKDIEHDEDHKGKDDDKAEKAGDEVKKDIEYDDKKDKEEMKEDRNETNGEFFQRIAKMWDETLEEEVQVTEAKMKDKAEFDADAEVGDHYTTADGNKVTKTEKGIKHEKAYKDEKEEAFEDTDATKDFVSDIKDVETVDEGDAFNGELTKVKTPDNADPNFTSPVNAKAQKRPYPYKSKTNETRQLREGRKVDDLRNHPIYTKEEAWDHYSKELAEQEMEETAVVVDAVQELDEIAKLAGVGDHSYSGSAGKDSPLTQDNTEATSCEESASPISGGTVCLKCNEEIVEDSCGCETNEQEELADPASEYTSSLESDPNAMEEDSYDGIGDMNAMEEKLNEVATRKDFRAVAELLSNIEDREKATKLAHHHADIFKAANDRFSKEKFFAAAGVDESFANAMSPVAEDEMEEGNEFTKARLDAIADGSDTFELDGKQYDVKGDTKDEKKQVESKNPYKQYAVKEDINVNITASGEQDALNLMMKLAGLPPVVVATADDQMDDDHGCDAVEEERDVEWSNTPDEKTGPQGANYPSGTDLSRSKVQDPATANKAANPLEKIAEEKTVKTDDLWDEYETILKDVKK